MLKCLLLLLLVGIFGNITTILVLFRNKKTSTTIYLILLAFADLTVTICVIPRWFLVYVLNFDVRHIGTFACQLHVFVTFVAGRTSNTCLVVMTIERKISTVKPHQFNRYCNIKIASAICCSIIIAISLLNAHIFYGFSLTKLSKTKKDAGLQRTENTSYLCNDTSAANIIRNSSDLDKNSKHLGMNILSND